ncbi:Reverse transcriptase (RNA-dependent DNA polymerase) [Nesidiocoris tenuis]|uniref:Reverse transcriptase (RNA-dependent DNA polymerase) n=1 Tax=Nesidiocoris tenuis TaxID=355587 RepID=A0ABN7B282_9HEMI|nr:Reverse transcriptase (RNA-dependent DNA polymerase) [Nesidiocoris tenuis]
MHLIVSNLVSSTAIIKVADDLGLYLPAKSNVCSRSDKPWFNKACRELRYRRQNLFRKLKRKGLSSPEWGSYVEASRSYRKAIKKAKRDYHAQLSSTLANTRNAGEFWSEIRKLRKNKRGAFTPSVGELEGHFDQLYPVGLANVEGVVFHGTFDPAFDREITLEELDKVLRNLKIGKAAGRDMIAYEFLKCLPDWWKSYIVELFNSILQSSTIPTEWAEIKTILLFKKGDERDLNNYRGISLINTTLKIFTQILLNRLELFSSQNNLIPENQAGFRKNRGCIDHIFTLHSLISINTRLKGRKLFAGFIDFSRAFDSIDHEILWQKMADRGISARFVNTLKSLYNAAHFSFQSGDKRTKTYRLDTGILQGDTLSPTLYSIFVSDFQVFLSRVGGAYLDEEGEVPCLFYADDLILFSTHAAGMRKSLKSLEAYCAENKLTINISKSKIVIFRKAGRVRDLKFHCAGQQLVVANSYNYLGVLFSSSGMFRVQANNAVKKGIAATGSVLPIVHLSQSASVQSWKQLFQSFCASTTLYAAEIWGLQI